jgi:RNA polymerase sigma factor (sigma-70 family)
MASSTDEQIIELLHRKDVNGISLLYDKYASALYGTIVRVINNTEIAEEALQDTFTKVWRNFESYDSSKGRLFTWLINIARNTAIDATRQKGFNRQNQPLENVVNTIDTQQSTTFNPDIIDVKLLTQKLTPEYQVLIDLIYFKGYTQVEAAEALNIPLGTVKTRLRTAIGVLKSLF